MADIEFVLVASPEYLEQRGHPTHPKDLKDHDCLVQTIEPMWRFNYGTEYVPLKIASRFSSDSYAALCTAAVAGLGIALLPHRLAASYLELGALKSLLANFPIEERPFYAAYAPGEPVPLKIRNLLDFLGDWFRQRPLSTSSKSRDTAGPSNGSRSTSRPFVKRSERLSA